MGQQQEKLERKWRERSKREEEEGKGGLSATVDNNRSGQRSVGIGTATLGEQSSQFLACYCYWGVLRNSGP